MSLLLVSALVVGYVVILVLVLALLRMAKQGDEDAERERRALVRSKRARMAHGPATQEEAERDAERRLAG